MKNPSFKLPAAHLKTPELTVEIKNQLIDQMWKEGVAPVELMGLFKKNAVRYNIDSFQEHTALIVFRDKFVHKYGFSLLSEKLLNIYTDFLKDKSVVEIGAGSGWLSHQLQKKSVDITPIDLNVGEANEYGFCVPFTKIYQTSAQEYLAHHTPQVVIMSWPNYQSDFAQDTLSLLKPGQTLIYVGEPEGGCCANDKFFELLEHKANLNEGATELFQSENLKWPSMHDNHFVYDIF